MVQNLCQPCNGSPILIAKIRSFKIASSCYCLHYCPGSWILFVTLNVKILSILFFQQLMIPQDQWPNKSSLLLQCMDRWVSLSVPTEMGFQESFRESVGPRNGHTLPQKVHATKASWRYRKCKWRPRKLLKTQNCSKIAFLLHLISQQTALCLFASSK